MSARYTEICNAAKKIATLAHEGQTRWDGSPYITHPARIAKKFFDDRHEEIERDDVEAVPCAMSWLHDVLEDTSITAEQLAEGLKDQGVEESVANDIVRGVIALTRQPGENYLQSIARVTANGYAMDVKMLDLMDNLSSLPENKRQMRDKYLLALAILQMLRSRMNMREQFWMVVDEIASRLSVTPNAPNPNGG